MRNLPKFKIRCSQKGKIMGGEVGLSSSQEEKFNTLLEREKPYTDTMEKDYNILLHKLDNPMTTGMKSYCKKWLNEQVFKRRKEVNSKYLDKGNFCEEWSVDFINKHLLEKNVKNEKFFENEFMTGIPDLVNNGIDDIKNSYDTSTFPLFENEIPNKDYEYQLNGYMHLCNKKTGRLIYTLNDLPVHLIEREAWALARKNGGQMEDYYEACKKHFTYPDIDQKDRIKIFHLEYNPEMIEQVENRVLMCREYIKTKLSEYKEEG